MTINQQDFITPITGNIVIQNNGARLVLQANTDLNTSFEGDESFKLILRKGSPEGPVVATTPVILIRDTSNTIIYSSLVSNLPAEAMADNANVIFTLRTVNISPADTLYYYTTGNVTSSNFVQGNTGSINLSVSQGLGIANIVFTANDIPANETRVFQLNITDTPSGTPKITSNTITILDTNLTQLTATGGTTVTSGGFRTHIFTSSGNFTVSRAGLNPTPVQYLIVAGGGGGAGSPGNGPQTTGGGGGAGGLIESTTTLPNSISPNTNYAAVIGAGGAPVPAYQTTNFSPSLGVNSSIFGQTAIGGGWGGSTASPANVGSPGGSGGGRNAPAPISFTAGAGTPGQGFPGSGANGANNYTGGGGGGAGGSGGTGGAVPLRNGGIGKAIPWVPASYGTPGPAPGRWFAGGGGAASGNPPENTGTGGEGGGGRGGGFPSTTPPHIGVSGSVNTGGGGGSSIPGPRVSPNPYWPNPSPSPNIPGGNGGSGIIVLRYPYTT